MGDFNLINLKDIGEPAAKVTNNFINKVANALGWVVAPKNVNSAIIEANKSIIGEIAERRDINPIERAAIISNFKRYVREYENQVDVVKIAMKHLDENAEPEEVDEDWIVYFFDKFKGITDEKMKLIWGKLLAGEFNEPNTYTKQLLHILSIMDSNLAKTFQKIRSSCFYRDPHLLTFIYRSNNDTVNNISAYREMGIIFRDMRELENLGLIQYKSPNFYEIQNNGKLIYYGNKIIKLTSEKKTIETGNASLTEVGKQLCRITLPEYDERILNICISSWEKLGYNPIVTVNE